MPAATVLMAVYNGERHLRPAIDSILAQTHRDLEFVIVDDGSTDRSRAIVETCQDARIRLVALDRNVGLSAALNAGLRAATSDLVARQDADDLSEPERIERQLAIFRSAPDLALLGTRGTVIDDSGTPGGLLWRPVEGASIRWYGLFDNPFAHTSVMFRTRVIRDELGGFDSAFDPFSQDYALWCRVMERYPVANLRDRLVRYRVLSSSIMGSLAGQRDTVEYQQRFARMVRQIVGENLARTLGAGAVQDADAGLIAKLVLGLEEESVGVFLARFEELLRLFLERHPLADRSADFRATLARQFDALAFRVKPPSRRAAGAIYAHALGHHPALVRHLSWPRALAQVVLGKRGRTQLASIYAPGRGTINR